MKLQADAFKECTRVLEIHMLARQLKEQGYDEAEVNKLASVRKRELVSQHSEGVSLLEKYVPKASTDRGRYTSFNIISANITSSEMVIDGKNITL